VFLCWTHAVCNRNLVRGSKTSQQARNIFSGTHRLAQQRRNKMNLWLDRLWNAADCVALKTKFPRLCTCWTQPVSHILTSIRTSPQRYPRTKLPLSRHYCHMYVFIGRWPNQQLANPCLSLLPADDIVTLHTTKYQRLLNTHTHDNTEFKRVPSVIKSADFYPHSPTPPSGYAYKRPLPDDGKQHSLHVKILIALLLWSYFKGHN
jgi:hypothetical protein